MSKDHPLDVQPLYEADGPGCSGPLIGWYSKGHHEPEDFVAAVNAFGAEPPDPDLVRHVWRRYVPWGRGETGGYMDKAKPGYPGAFPVTLFETIYPSLKASGVDLATV